MKRYFRYLQIILILSILLSCNTTKKISIFDKINNIPAKNYYNYNFDPESSIISRVIKPPDFIMDYLIKNDNGENYTGYFPTKEELEIIESYIKLLPKYTIETLKEKLIAIYFINDFIGSGMADYVIDENKNIYTTLFINTETLKKNISDWMTYRENTCFIKDVDNIKIKIDCGNEYLGLLYVLLHETTHIVDYIHHITPFVEYGTKELLEINQNIKNKFTEDYWINYNEPNKKYNKRFMKKLTFYGLNNGPKIKISHSKLVYNDLVETPYVSMYSCMSWAEDLAELETWYHFTQILNQPYEIVIYENGKISKEYNIMENGIVKRRYNYLANFY